MAEDKKSKEEESSDKKDDRPDCPLCTQKYDPDKSPILQSRVPVPMSKVKLLISEQSIVDEAVANWERIKTKRRRMVNRSAKELHLRYRSNLAVEADPRITKHANEYFFWESGSADIKVYLGVEMKEEDLKELDGILWEMGERADDIEEATNEYNRVLREISNQLNWPHRPILFDGKGHFIAQDAIKEAIKEDKEREEERKKKRRR